MALGGLAKTNLLLGRAGAGERNPKTAPTTMAQSIFVAGPRFRWQYNLCLRYSHWRSASKDGQRMIGRYIISYPAVCHGQPTFRGTRIPVADVMEQVAGGIAWETIVKEWRGDVSVDAISEAVRLAIQAFRDHSAQYTAQEYVLE